MNCSVPAVMGSVHVCPMSLASAVTLVLPNITGILQAKDVSNVSAILLALLVGTVTILGSAHVGPTLVGAAVIDVLLVIMDSHQQEGLWYLSNTVIDYPC